MSSPKSTTINVQLTPQLPLLSGTTEVCEGASANIQITNASAYPPGTVFIWQPSGVNQPVYNIVSASPSNEGFYTVEVLVGQCLSATSASFFLKVNKRPLPPAIIANTPVCEGDTLFLNATPQPNVTDWIWSGPAGFGNGDRVFVHAAGQAVLLLQRF